MANTKITLTFGADGLTVDQGLEVTVVRSKDGVSIPMYERFIKGQRRNVGQIGMGNEMSWSGVQAAQAFVTYFLMDWNTTNIMFAYQASNVVVIEIDPSWTFTYSITMPGVTAVVEPGVNDTYVVNSWSIVPSVLNPCTHVSLQVNTSEVTDNVVVNNTTYHVVNTNTIAIEMPRLIRYDKIVLNSGGSSINLHEIIGYFYVRRMLAGNVSTVISNQGSLATVTIQVAYQNQLPGTPALNLEYSLDGTEWQTSAVFTGQENGDYTVYIRDGFGCQVQHNYSVNVRSGAGPFFYLSKRNSITVSKEEEWDYKSIMKNDDNTLSETSIANINYKEDILVQRSDEPSVIQFKSNWETHNAYLEEECEGETELPILKMSNNMGRFASMDGVMYKSKEGVTGLYFIDGNTYNEDGTPSGQYILNGNLPDFAIVGQFIEIKTTGGFVIGYFPIADVIYDSLVDKRVILFNYNFQDAQQDIIVKSTYNLLEFEVYHFLVDLSLTTRENYRLRIELSDPEFGTERYFSDNIYVEDIHKGTVAIEYYGDDNKDIFYSYNIKHFIRLRLARMYALIMDEHEKSQGDNSSVLVKSEVYDGNAFEFEPMTRDMFLKACLALSSPFVLINSIGYIKNESVNYENIEGTNLYELKINMLKSGLNKGAFTNNPTIGAPVIYIPNVLAGNTGLIKL